MTRQADTAAWRIIQCTSGKEDASEAILARLGYPETFHPRRRVDLRPRSKARRSAHQGPIWGYRAWVPGYTFVRCEAIACHRVTGPHGRIHLRVLAPGGVPYTVTDQQMAQMRDVPKRVKELIEEAKQAEREAWERVRPRVGHKGKVMTGPFEGEECLVLALTPLEAKVQVGAMRLTCPAMDVQRLVS